MRSRLARAAAVERREHVEEDWCRETRDRLAVLARAIETCTDALPVSKVALPTTNAHYAVTHDPEASLPFWWPTAVKAAVVAVVDLLERRVGSRNLGDAAVLPGQVSASDHTGTEAAAEGTSPSSSDDVFYTAFVRGLIEQLVRPTTKTFADRKADHPTVTRTSGPVEGDQLLFAASFTSALEELRCVSILTEAPSFFMPGLQLHVPTAVCIVWGCSFYLLEASGSQLGIRSTDRFASWLDLASVMLGGLKDPADPSVRSVADEAAPNEVGQPMDIAVVNRARADAHHHVKFLHCIWWWCNLMFEYGNMHGCWPSSVPSPIFEGGGFTRDGCATSPKETAITSTAVTDGVALDGIVVPAGATHALRTTSLEPLSSQEKDEFLDLWYVGCTTATAYLAQVVLPQTANFLRASLADILFSPANPSVLHHQQQHWWSSKVATMQASLMTVRCMVEALFPHAQRYSCVEAAGVPTPPPLNHADAAVTGFVGLLLHKALQPLAERVLSDPHSLQDHFVYVDDAVAAAPGRVPFPSCSAVTSPIPPRDGWSGEEDEGWPDAEVKMGVISPPCTRKEGEGKTFEVPRTTRGALHFALDALEQTLGDIVGCDPIVMTLRRL